MTSSDGGKNSATTLDSLLAHLREEHLQQAIDWPLQRAASAFESSSISCTSPKVFLERCGDFVAHLALHGFLFPIKLPPSDARSIALRVLQQTYQSETGRGYDAALTDACYSTHQNMDSIGLQLLQGIRMEERRKYVQAVLAHHIFSLNWEERKRLGKAALDLLGNYGPESLKALPDALVANEIEALLMVTIRIEHAMQEQIDSAQPGFLKPGAPLRR